MALTPEEIDHCYSAISDAAAKYGFDWVVAQTQSQIALGKIRTGKIRPTQAPLPNTPDEEAPERTKGPSAKYTLSDDYTPEEKLRILIEALRYATRGVSEVASVVSEFMKDNIVGLDGVAFMPEGISKQSFRLDLAEIESRERSVAKFDSLLVELEEAI
jgi:hypothetical protein